MRKIIILALSLMLLLTACSSDKKAPAKGETTAPAVTSSMPENYVGEGTLATLKTLVNMHAKFETEYFIQSHPAIDKSKAVERDGKTFAPVTGGEFKTYEELSKAVYETYTKETAPDALKAYSMYSNIDGKLYFDMEFEPSYRGERYTYNWSGFTIEPTEATEGKIVFTVYLKYAGGDDAAITMTAVMENGDWRLVR